METFIVVFMIIVASCHGFPASSIQNSGRMTPNSHPMLASVFNVMNAVRDISKGASFGSPKTLPVTVKQHQDVAVLNPLSAVKHQGSTLVKPAIEHVPPQNTDGDRGIVAGLGDMQCSLCRRVNDPECIRKFCWVEPAQTILIAPNKSPGVLPSLQGQAPGVIHQKSMPGPALDVTEQSGLPGPTSGIIHQKAMPSPVLGVMEHGGLPSPASGVIHQTAMPSPVLGVIEQSGMPVQNSGVIDQRGIASQALNKDHSRMPVPVAGVIAQSGMPGPAVGVMRQSGIPDPAVGIVGQSGMPGPAVGVMRQSGMPDPAEGVVGQGGMSGSAVGVMDQSGMQGPAVNVIDQSGQLTPVNGGMSGQDGFMDLWPPTFSGELPAVEPRLKNALNPPTHVAPVPAIPAPNQPATPMFAVPRGLEALINMQATLPSNQAVPASQSNVPQQLNAIITGTAPANPITRPVFPTNASGMQTLPSDGSLHQRQGLDLVRNTLVDHPIKAIPGSETMFETHVDKIHPDHTGSQGLSNTVSGENMQVAPTNGQTNIGLQPLNVPIQMNQHSGQPLPDRPITGHMGSNIRPSVPTANDIFGTVESVVPPRPDTPAVAVASDVFGGSSDVSGAAGGIDRPTLVLKQHRGGGNKVGIVIGDTDPNNGMLSVLETSGQIPAVRSNLPPQTPMASDDSFVPLSSVNVQHQHGTHGPGQPNPSGTQTLTDQSRMVPLSSVNPGALSPVPRMAAGPPAMMSAPISGEAQPGPVAGNPDLMFPPGFVESVLSSTTPLPTMNPVRRAELHSWGSQFLPTDRQP